MEKGGGAEQGLGVGKMTNPQSQRPYFFWDYDITEDEVREILRGDDKVEKVWVITRILALSNRARHSGEFGAPSVSVAPRPGTLDLRNSKVGGQCSIETS